MSDEASDVILELSRANDWLPDSTLRRALQLGLIDHIALRHEDVSDDEGNTRQVTTTSFVLRMLPRANRENDDA